MGSSDETQVAGDEVGDDLGNDLGDIDSGLLAELKLLARAPPRPLPEEFTFEPGALVADHFRVVRRLGSGAMGVVFLAQDERLGRRVAIKVHLATEALAVARLEREARALAKVSHPNVLAVHEVGKVHNRLFVATEYVEGPTLRAWAQTSHPWREVVAVFVAAGKGLVAAHDKDLVHRDFKPDNVLIGDDGRVRVADFGLARAAGRDPDAVPPGDSASGDDVLTRTGAAVGTPAYMAPEQFEGEVSPAADQFSFAISLAEVLYGKRPYGEVLSCVAREDEIEFVDVPAAGPAWLRRIVRKAAALRPEARYRSMQALVEALELGLRRRTRQRVWGAVGLAVVASIGLATSAALLARPDTCADAHGPIDEVWNARRQRALAESFARAHATMGEAAWRPLARRLDEFAAAWTEHRAASCRATNVEGVQSERILERAMACFDRTRAELDAVLRALERVDGGGIVRAWRTIPSPVELEPCRDANGLLARADREHAATDVYADLRYAKALAQIGGEGGVDVLTDVIARARAAHDDGVVAQSELERGSVALDAGDLREAIARGEEAYFIARDAGVPDVERRAAIHLADCHGIRGGEPAAGRVWLGLARRVVGVPPSQVSASGTRVEAIFLEGEGRYDEAIALIESRLPTVGEGEDHGRLLLYDALATSLDAAGRYDDALETYEAALAIARRLSGDPGSHVPFLLSNEGLVLSRVGRHDEAIAVHTRAVELLDATLGPEYASAMGQRLNLAIAYMGADQPRLAVNMFPAVLAATRARHGETHPDVAIVLEARGACSRLLGDLDAALADFEGALDIARTAHGDGHPLVGTYHLQLARTHLERGELAAAKSAYAAAVGVFDRRGPSSHPDAVEARAGVADLAADETSPDSRSDAPR